MSERKYEFAYIVSRRNIVTNESIPCAVFKKDDSQEAYDTAEAYNKQFEDEGHDGYVFEVHITALYD